MAKVSIIIPTYNVEAYLRQCMESVVRQTLSDIEIVCVNDGSTDGSLAILQEYAANDSRIVLVDQPNGGYGKAMNAGFDKSTGEYIGIVEPDDYVALSMYEDLYRIASENQLDYVKSDHYRFWNDGRENKDVRFRYVRMSENPDDYAKVFDPSQTPEAMDFVMNTWSGIYRRAFLVENNIRHHETPGASFQDLGFFFQTSVFARRGMIVAVDGYRVRRDNPNSSVHNSGKVYAPNKEYDYIRDILMEHPDIWNRFKYMYWKRRFHTYTFTLGRIGEEYKTEYARYVSAELKRAKDAGLLRQKEFGPEKWQQLQLLLKDPDRFVNQNSTGTGESREVQEIKNSHSYKLGFALTAVPRRIKKLYRGVRWRVKKVGRKIFKR